MCWARGSGSLAAGLVTARVHLFGIGALLVGCATEEEILFGDPEDLALGTSAGVTSGGNCVPDPTCEVSFRDDVLPPLLEQARCADGGCHATAIAGFAFPTAATEAREALVAYTFQGADGYVVPCEPERSKMLCNLVSEDGGGSCGSPMPKLLDDAVDDVALQAADVQALADWISCGAPDN